MSSLICLLAHLSLSTAPQTGLVVVVKANADAVLAEAARAALTRTLDTLPDISPVWTPVVRERLGLNPEYAFEQCGKDLSCIAEYGARAGCDQIMYVRMLGSGTRKARKLDIQLLVIGVKSRAIEHKGAVRIDKEDEIARKVPEAVRMLYGHPADAPPGRLPFTEIAPPPLLIIDTTPAMKPVEASLSPREIVSAPQPQHKMATITQTSKRTLTFRTFVGAPVAVVGVALIGVGAGFAVAMGNDRNAIDAATPQTQVAQLSARANQEAQVANVLFIAGGIAAAAGLSLLAWDIFRDGAVNVSF